MSLKDLPHYTLPASELADWLESKPDMWWFVDGDPILTSEQHFPCPSDELVPLIRKVGKTCWFGIKIRIRSLTVK